MKSQLSRVLPALVCAVLAAEGAWAQLNIVNNLPGSFIDISGTGTNLGNNCDDCSSTFVAAHGNMILPAGTINASSNGTLCVPAQNGFSNAALTAASTAGYYPFWDDLRTDLNGGDIFAQNLADRTIIQWNNVVLFGSAGTDFGTFQVQIFSSGPILAQMIYQDVTWADLAGHDNGASATIGAVATDHVNYYQWSFNTASIAAGTVLSILPPTSLRVDCNPANPGAVPPGGNTVLSARVTQAIPPSPITSVTVDLTSIGGGAAVVMRDDGVPPDATAGDLTYTVGATVSNATTPGLKSLGVSVADADGHTAVCSIALDVLDPNILYNVRPHTPGAAGANGLSGFEGNLGDPTLVYDREVGDNFSVPAGGDWNINRVTTSWVQFTVGDPNAITGAEVEFYNLNGDNTVGSLIAAATVNNISRTATSAVYFGRPEQVIAMDISPVTLPAGGNYFVQVQILVNHNWFWLTAFNPPYTTPPYAQLQRGESASAGNDATWPATWTQTTGAVFNAPYKQCLTLSGTVGNQCPADWNGDGQLDFFDYLDFVQDFNDDNADYNGDGQTDFFDYLDFAADFDAGCD